LESGENMKIIISKNSPFIVEDEDGNVLYTFQPIDDKEIDKMTLDERDAFIEESIRDSYK
jgi:hypothetical protein